MEHATADEFNFVWMQQDALIITNPNESFHTNNQSGLCEERDQAGKMPTCYV